MGTIVEACREYMRGCPALATLNRIVVDYLADPTDSVSIEPEQVDPFYQRNIDGTTVRQFQFSIAARLFYSDELAVNIANAGIFEDVVDWLEAKDAAKEYPTLDGNRVPCEIKALTSGWLFGDTEDLAQARYQITIRLLYDQPIPTLPAPEEPDQNGGN